MRPSVSLYTLLVVAFALIMSGCETTNRALTAAERVTKGRTGQTIIDLAGGKDPAQIAKRQLDQYARDPDALFRNCARPRKTLRPSSPSLG